MTKTILIVDDDQTLAALLKEGLESSGYKVLAAFDAEAGLEQARHAAPDAIILDFYISEGGGQEVYQRLRKDKATVKTPIVFSTGVPLEEVKGKIQRDDDTYFLKKPVGLSQVLELLEAVLGEKAGRAPAAAPAAPAPAPKKKAPKFHEFAVRVTYADTDKLGIIYYANYFKYFEQGRTELLRSLGVRYRDLEIQRKLFIPAVEAYCRYVAPSRYDDLLVVRTWISDLGVASISFANEIVNRELSDKTVARGFSRHAVVNDLWRNARVPKDIREVLEPYIGHRPDESSRERGR